MSAYEGYLHNDATREESRLTLSSIIAASHELKAPLVLIRQLSLMLSQDDITEAERKVISQRILLTSERGLRLTSDLTKTARLEDTLFDLEPLNPIAICEEVVDELEPLFAAHGRRLKIRGGRRTLLLVAHPDLLRRILINFSDNALHYSESESNIDLSVQVIARGTKIRLGVRDYGPALSADVWRSLKERLGKSIQPIHARPLSSGLGLYIASLFADSMNGTIGAIRHHDGATFYVELATSHQLSLL